jgi:hypothetical protein
VETPAFSNPARKRWGGATHDANKGSARPGLCVVRPAWFRLPAAKDNPKNYDANARIIDVHAPHVRRRKRVA